MTSFFRGVFWLVLSLLWCMVPLMAQEAQTQILLTTETTDVQTGEFYTVQLDVREIAELWSGDIIIRYDPDMVYVVGTDSGSPVEMGDFLQGRTIFNVARDGTVRYAPTLFNPSDPVSGSGTLGTFTIFPLQAGTTQFVFERVNLSRLVFETNDAGERIATESEAMDVLPILLELSITGELATPPPEATATATPTITSTPAPDETAEAPTATLFNATAAPATTTDTDATSADVALSPVILIAVGLIVVSLLGLIILWVVARNRAQKR